MTFQETSDSVRAELFRLAVDCSLSDVAYVKMHTSPYRDDADLDATKKKATTFYSALDKQPIYNKGNAREKIELYRSFLAATKEHGINTQKELLSFIEEEDGHFRTFLSKKVAILYLYSAVAMTAGTGCHLYWSLFLSVLGDITSRDEICFRGKLAKICDNS